MTTTYTTSDNVAALLQITINGSTTPTATQVDNIINRMEDYIDDRSGHAWRETTITNEYNDITVYETGVGYRIDLQNRKIKQLSSGTDKIEVWNGQQWEDYVSTKTEGQGPYNGDFWVDYTNGVVYINNRLILYPKGVRATYRFGSATVNKTVEDIATKLAAVDVLQMYDKEVNFVEDGGDKRPTHDQRIQRWLDQTEKEFPQIIEFKVFL